jgi:crotonobetainyl-CoA:carnitine CoA-transferase CaiB-like acyl-CoA transferase
MTKALSDKESRAAVESYGYEAQRTEAEWVEHFDDHPEAYAALYAVAVKGWGLNAVSRVHEVSGPYHGDAPQVEPWVTSPRVPHPRRRAVQ